MEPQAGMEEGGSPRTFLQLSGWVGLNAANASRKTLQSLPSRAQHGLLNGGEKMISRHA